MNSLAIAGMKLCGKVPEAVSRGARREFFDMGEKLKLAAHFMGERDAVRISVKGVHGLLRNCRNVRAAISAQKSLRREQRINFSFVVKNVEGICMKYVQTELLK